LITKLLRFARPEEYADEGPGHTPDMVIRETLPLVQHLLTGAKIDVVLDLQAGGAVSMNQTELQQVLVNLMVNSIQAMPKGGTLRLRTWLTGVDRMTIEVADSGSGMEPSVLARIFDPFFTTKRALGTGLGLSICRTLVTRAGGTISASSTAGEGSRFVIDLPLSH